MSPETSQEKKKPGRKSETPAQRLARLEKDIVAARRAVEQAEQTKLSAIGSAVLAEAAENLEFQKMLRHILRSRVTTKAGKAALAGELAEHSP